MYRKSRTSEVLAGRVEIMNKITGRVPRQRPRDPEEQKMLGRLIRGRYERLLERGELVFLGPRRWRWHFPEFQQGKIDA